MSKKLISGTKCLIVSVDSGKLLRIKDDSDKDDAKIVIGHPMDRDIKTREWKLEKLSNKMYKIKNVKTGKYLSVKTDSKKDGVEMVQKRKDDSPKQQFKIVLTKKGDFRIELKDEKLHKMRDEKDRDLRKEKRDKIRIDDLDESDSDSDSDSDSSDEERELRKDRRRDEIERRHRRKEKKRVLDVKGSSKRDGAKIVQWKLTGEKNQRFRIISIETKSKL